MGKNENIELRRILDITKSKILLILFILISFTLLGYYYSYYHVVPKYKSTATMLLIPNDNSESKAITTTDLALNSELITTYSNIAKQPKVLKQVIQNLGLDMTEQQLLNQMQVKIISSTYIIEITVMNESPKLAMEITKELSDVFLNEIKQIYNLNNIGIVDEAKMPNTPYNISHMKDLAMFFMGGLVVSGILVVGIYIFDNTIKEEDELERYVKVKSLGKIPLNSNQKSEIIDRSNTKSYITECINTIRTNILYMNSVKGSKAILITSCTPREGKSWVSTNIAVAFAETNKRVLLIDCDMRKGRQHKIFKVSNEEGLSSYLYSMTGDSKKDAKLGKQYIQETQIPNLHVLTNGPIPPNPSELIDSGSMAELIKIAKAVYDVVIIDAPPCKLVTDSMILSRMADSTILVANSHKTKMGDLKEVKKSIEAVGGKIIGAIVNQVKIAGKTYGNTYYYGHHSEENKCEVKERPIVSVSDLIDEAIPKLKIKDSKVTLAEKTENSVQENTTVTPVVDLEKTYDAQNKHLEEVISSLSDIKKQLKNNIMESKLNDKEKAEELEKLISAKIEELSQSNSSTIKEELQNMNMAEEFNRIAKELEMVKANFQITKEDLEYTIKQGMLSKEEVEDIVKNEMISKETIEGIVNNGRITKQDIEEVVNNGRLSKQDIEDIVNNEKLTKQDIEEVLNSNKVTIEDIENVVNNGRLNKEDIVAIVNDGRLSKQDVEDIITTEMLTGEAVRNIVKDEMVSKEEIAEIVKAGQLNPIDIQEMIGSEKLTRQDIEEIVNSNKVTIEDIESVVNNGRLNKEDVAEIVNNGRLSKQDVEDIITTEMLTGEAVRNIVREEMVSKEAELNIQDIEDMITTKMLTGEAVRNIVRDEVVSKETMESMLNNKNLTREDVETIVNNARLNKEDIQEMIDRGRVSREEIAVMINSARLTKQDVEEIVNSGRLTRQEVAEIVNNGKLTKQDIAEIVNNGRLSKQDVEDIITTEMLTGEAVRNIVNDGRLTKEEVEAIINKEKITKQEMEALIRNETLNQEAIAKMMKQELARINYVDQINQINERMTSLQENYLELLNIIKTKQLDIEEPDGENIIHLKSFKKQAEKKKRIYSIQNEMIPYEELEKTAICVIPLKTNTTDSSEEDIEDKVATR